MYEPDITINGRKLTAQEVTTVRVALESFASALQDGLGDDAHGRRMTKLHQQHISTIREKIYIAAKADSPA